MTQTTSTKQKLSPAQLADRLETDVVELIARCEERVLGDRKLGFGPFERHLEENERRNIVDFSRARSEFYMRLAGRYWDIDGKHWTQLDRAWRNALRKEGITPTSGPGPNLDKAFAAVEVTDRVPHLYDAKRWCEEATKLPWDGDILIEDVRTQRHWKKWLRDRVAEGQDRWQMESCLLQIINAERIVGIIVSSIALHSWETQQASKTTGHQELGEHEANPGNVFALRGKKFVVRYGDGAGDTFYLNNSKGGRQLAYLLARPNEWTSALDLMRIDRPGSALLGERRQPIVDKEAIADLKDSRSDLSDRIDRAEMAGDASYAAELQREKDEVAKELALAMGLSGKSRSFKAPQQQAGNATGKNIGRTLESVKGADVSLFTHLKSSLILGQDIRYAPPKKTTGWTTN